MYKSSQPHLSVRSGVFYFVRRMPIDVERSTKAERITLGSRTRWISVAARSAQSVNQRPPIARGMAWDMVKRFFRDTGSIIDLTIKGRGCVCESALKTRIAG